MQYTGCGILLVLGGTYLITKKHKNVKNLIVYFIILLSLKMSHSVERPVQLGLCCMNVTLKKQNLLFMRRDHCQTN